MATIFSIVGQSETGKTTLITKLVCELKRRGVSVGVIKHCPRGFDLDTEGKDSWRFKDAGADGIFVLSPGRYGMVKDMTEELSIGEIVTRYFGDVDLILTEGCRDGAEAKKVEVLRSSVGKELSSAPGELTAIVSDFDLGLDLPQFSHDDIKGIVDFMEEFMGEEEGKLLELKVNGKSVTLNPFVQNMLTNTIMGMVSSLRIEGEPKVVELRVSQEETRAP